MLDIDVPAGVTLWFKPRLEGPLSIEFEATAVAEGGPNDQVSDLNVFWMANNVDGQQPVFAQVRSGKFADYNDSADVLRRPRRQPQHDDAHSAATSAIRCCGRCALSTTSRGDPYMLVPNQRQTIRLMANGRLIEYWRDGTAHLLHRGCCALRERLVRAAHDVQPPAHPAPAHLAACPSYFCVA